MASDSAVSKRSGNGKRTRRGPHTRKQILDASLRLFSERGFARTTVRDIAHEAQITDAAIYYHFESKREVLDALVEERGFVAGLQELQRVSAELPLRETLLWMARGAINIMDENRDFLRLIIMEGLGGDEAAVEQYRRLTDLWEHALTAVLERHEERGELTDDAPGAMARQIIYLILMAFQDTIMGRHISPEATPEERREALFVFAEQALAHFLPRLQPASP
ncbi:MAG: TetR/AcrR family transcriptional regulator [Dehalococcoidia bacterium]